MARRMRPEIPSDPAACVRVLWECRDATIRLSMQIPIGSNVDKLAHGVLTAIDALAAELTGDREYFWSVGAVATEGQQRVIEEKAARERGELRWKK
ncbi:hypothetical protein CR492_01690 [Methylocella silvestris]|uniref:Uncharacterized protein n=1 Tax=Methylocella silvestris TaxID=199596 RepID=A0A2J7TLL1_METSI|nr:hypothetical protein CR492_01690 [Methylocella silvestris]